MTSDFSKLEFNGAAIGIHWFGLVGYLSILVATLMGGDGARVAAFYAEQGTAGSGYITDEFLRDVAEKAGVPDLDQWEEDRNDPRWVSQPGRNADVANSVGIQTTPRVALEDSEGDLTLLDDDTPEAIEAAIDEALSVAGRHYP